MKKIFLLFFLLASVTGYTQVAGVNWKLFYITGRLAVGKGSPNIFPDSSAIQDIGYNGMKYTAVYMRPSLWDSIVNKKKGSLGWDSIRNKAMLYDGANSYPIVTGSNTITINGNSQSLSNNASFTLATDSATYVTQTKLKDSLNGVRSYVAGLYIPLAQKDAVNGVPSLDGGGKVPFGELPPGLWQYKGTWNAFVNVPSLANGTGRQGDIYMVSDSGTINFGAGNISFNVNDIVLYNGSQWQKVGPANQVIRVNGKYGYVTLTTSDISEGTNLYYTDTRSRAAHSAGYGVLYNSTTGIIAADTTTLKNIWPTKLQLQTSGQASVSWGNITGAPSAIVNSINGSSGALAWTTLSQYGITDAITYANAAATYLRKTTDTMSGPMYDKANGTSLYAYRVIGQNGTSKMYIDTTGYIVTTNGLNVQLGTILNSTLAVYDISSLGKYIECGTGAFNGRRKWRHSFLPNSGDTAYLLLREIQGTTNLDTSICISNITGQTKLVKNNIATYYSDVSNNTGGAETTLATTTIPAKTFTDDGNKVYGYYSGVFANSTSGTRKLRLTFAGTEIANTGTVSISALGDWSIECIIYRTGSTTARTLVKIYTPSLATAVYVKNTKLTGLSFTTTNNLVVLGTTTNDTQDITLQSGNVEYEY